MAIYEYTAKDHSGSDFSGMSNDVNGVAALRDELDKMGYVLIKARRASAKGKKHGKIKPSEVVAFTYKFAGMYSAGLTIIKCLETLEEQTENSAFRDMLTDIRQNVETGSSLRKAFEKYKDIFSDFFLGMVEAGESGGKLATALEMSADYLEKQAELKRKVKAAFIYPLVVGLVCIVVVGFLLVFIVPMFSKLYQKLHVPLPGPTQVLVGLSVLLRDWWWALLIISVALIILSRKLKGNHSIKARWDSLKLKIPVFAKLNQMIIVSHFTRTFAMLASVGVSFIEALDVANKVAHNYVMTKITEELQASIQAGNPVGKSLKKYGIFPPMITQMAISGEEIGQLPDMLNKGADFLDKDIERSVNSLIVKLEPALTVIMGSIVGFILMGVYLPMLDYMRHLK
jgi:type II secretory pathway component PulF